MGETNTGLLFTAKKNTSKKNVLICWLWHGKYKWRWCCCSHNNPYDHMQIKNKPIYILLLGLCCGTFHFSSQSQWFFFSFWERGEQFIRHIHIKPTSHWYSFATDSCYKFKMSQWNLKQPERHVHYFLIEVLWFIGLEILAPEGCRVCWYLFKLISQMFN